VLLISSTARYVEYVIPITGKLHVSSTNRCGSMALSMNYLKLVNKHTTGGTMAATQFVLDSTISNGTSNISYLLDQKHQELLRKFTPGMVESAFGPGDDRCFDQSKGYTDPEWYWQASDGNVWGIGWRWGSPRLRGKGVHRADQVISHPDKLTAYEFIEFLKIELSRKVCPSCGFRKEPGDPVHNGFRCDCWQK